MCNNKIELPYLTYKIPLIDYNTDIKYDVLQLNINQLRNSIVVEENSITFMILAL